MAQIIAKNTQVSSLTSEFRTVGDFALVHQLLKRHSLYNIPQHLRQSIVDQAAETLDPLNAATDSEKIAAAKLLLEMDKRNIDLIKIAMPQKHEHIQVKDASDEELEAMIIEAHKRITNGS